MKRMDRPERRIFILKRNPDRSYSCKLCSGCEDLFASLSRGLKCGISLRQEELGKEHFPFPVLKTLDKYSSAVFVDDWKEADNLIALLEMDREKYTTDKGEYNLKKAEEVYTTLQTGLLEAIELCCLTYDTA